MTITTFEKYLREQEGLVVAENSGGAYKLLCNNKQYGSFVNDRYSGAAGFLIQKLRSIYPEAAQLPSSPVNQIVRGTRVDELLDAIDTQGLADLLSTPAARKAVDWLSDEDLELLQKENPTQVQQYLIANVLHKLAVTAHTGVVLQSTEPLPFCTEDEFKEVAACNDNTKSLRWYGKHGHLPDMVVACFRTMHPNAVLSPDKRELVVGGDQVTLLDVLGLEPLPDWLKALNHDDLKNFKQGPVGPVSLPAAVPSMPGPSSAAPACRNRPEEAVFGEANVEVKIPVGAQAGVDHVIEWADRDANSLTPAEKDACFYGFKGGFDIMKNISKSRIKNLFTGIKVGEHQGYVVITTVATGLRTLIGSRAALTDEQYAVLAAGQVLRRKSLFTFSVDGIWTRLHGDS